MGMTISEKIIALHTKNPCDVYAGALVFAKLDLVMSTDITTPLSLETFEKLNVSDVFDRDKIVLINDHLVPAKDIRSAEFAKRMKQFAKKYKIKNYFEVGRAGICHQFLPEKGMVLPCDLIMGADSHTCTYGAVGAFATGIGSTDLAASWAIGENWFKVPSTIRVNLNGKLNQWVCGKDIILFIISRIGVSGAMYKSLEFGGPVIRHLPMSDRFTICNMAAEAGAKTGIIEPDEITIAYVKKRTNRDFSTLTSDADCTYEKVFDFDISGLIPQVAVPPSPANAVPVTDVLGVELDQVFIGSCTNGRIEDMRIANAILKKAKKIHDDIRLIVAPGTQETILQMIKEGIYETIIRMGGIITPPSCGPCMGAHLGVMGKHEVVLSTSNRNFVGRMGDPSAKIYLSGPAVAAASAVTGRISHPDEI